MKRLVPIFLMVAALAFYQQATGNGFTADRKPTEGAQRGLVRPIFGGEADCVQLGGDGYEKVSCTAPAVGAAAPVKPSEVVAAGEFGGTGHGPVLTGEQVERLWVQQGGNAGIEAHVASAVAMAESGRRPAAANLTNTDSSKDFGLFQINTIHRKRFEQVTGVPYASGVHDAALNTRFAVHLQHEQGWTPWVAYNTGAHRRYL